MIKLLQENAFKSMKGYTIENEAKAHVRAMKL